MKYTIRHKEQINPPFEYAKRLLQETDKPIIITVSKQKRQRSINQNAYYFGVVLKIMGEELGYFVDDLHHALATKFLKKVIDLGDESIETYRSTATLTTIQFEEYLQNIRIFASSELNIFIPLPNECLDDDENY